MERRSIDVRGIVQGVGFRPFVYRLATRLGLGGSVRNQTGRVVIEVEGEPSVLDRFLVELAGRPPPLARIERLSWEQQPPRGEDRFRIEASDADGAGTVFVSPDAATCRECVAELFDPADRRFGYPFLNCTNCGPRLTIVTGAPYDRARTTMAAFTMCAACRAEYEDPGDRRFHAQPTACPVCGPQLRAAGPAGEPVPVPDPLAWFAAALLADKIGALKGIGGYHLACDARSGAAVAELRRRKHRDEKPFAVMVPDAETAEAIAEVGPGERALLQSPEAPIILLRKRLPHALAAEVAPRNPWVGVILPYTPLHHLLARAVGGIPLVMTSGNRSDEPIAYREEAAEELAGIADVFLTHDRPIHVRCDDSVTRVVDGIELPVRRSRGYAPRSIPLPFDCPSPVLAVGGQLKATFALARGREAFLSHHLGDLDHYDAYRAFEADVTLYEQLVAIEPEWLAHDQHPDYATTRYAQARTAHPGVRVLGVQHHHAHMAACMAEHGLTGPVIGVTFDGTGYGTDGTIWGGEFLVGDYRNFNRAAFLRPVGLPGGDRAIREPWRMAAAYLVDAGCGDGPLRARGLQAFSTVLTMIERRINTPLTSSAGRLFDAVASIAGVRDRVSYEGQAAAELEGLATDAAPDGSYPFVVDPGHPGGAPEPHLIVDTRPLVRAVAADVAAGASAARISRRFHTTLVDLVADVCGRIRAATGVGTVVLSGGVFLNALLTSEVCVRLGAAGFQAYRHRLVPPNDGGLSLGQVAVAAARLT